MKNNNIDPDESRILMENEIEELKIKVNLNREKKRPQCNFFDESSEKTPRNLIILEHDEFVRRFDKIMRPKRDLQRLQFRTHGHYNDRRKKLLYAMENDSWETIANYFRQAESALFESEKLSLQISKFEKDEIEFLNTYGDVKYFEKLK